MPVLPVPEGTALFHVQDRVLLVRGRLHPVWMIREPAAAHFLGRLRKHVSLGHTLQLFLFILDAQSSCFNLVGTELSGVVRDNLARLNLVLGRRIFCGPQFNAILLEIVSILCSGPALLLNHGENVVDIVILLVLGRGDLPCVPHAGFTLRRIRRRLLSFEHLFRGVFLHVESCVCRHHFWGWLQ